MSEEIKAVLEKVREEKAVILASIQALQTSLEKLQFTEDFLRKSIGEPAVATSATTTPAPEQHNGSAPQVLQADRFAGKPRFEACELVLRENGRPMKTVDIANYLQSKGYQRELPSNRLQGALFTAMLRKPETFRKIGRGTWGVVDAEY